MSTKMSTFCKDAVGFQNVDQNVDQNVKFVQNVDQNVDNFVDILEGCGRI